MNKIDFKKYKRFFAFGCSFTAYSWPTWADIISLEIPDSYNYGKCGAGNFFIYQSLIEAIVKHKISKDDLVMVMFSNVTREDRYTDDEHWLTPGNLYFQNIYSEEFIKKFFSLKGYLMRDLTLVEGVDRTLQTIGCDYELMTMIQFQSESSDGKMMDGLDYVLDFYKNTIQKVKPSVFEVLFKNNWNSRPNRPKYNAPWSKTLLTDNHPSPVEHLEFLNKTFAIDFNTNTIEKVNEWNNMTFNAKTLAELETTFDDLVRHRYRKAARL